jgi:bifunctional non-homologous end joining protein LigD
MSVMQGVGERSAGIVPMQPVPGRLPVGGQWSYEVDWSGIRLLADVDQGTLCLRTLEGDDVTSRFPEFAGLADVVADGLFDGEAVLLDAGQPSSLALFDRLRRADPRKARSLARERPAIFMVYDVLRLYGVPLTERPLEERRATLGRLSLDEVGRIQVSPVYDDGVALLAGVREQGLPGVMARRRDTGYDAESPQDWVRVVAGVDTAPTEPTTVSDLPVTDLSVPERPEAPPAGPALSAIAPPLPGLPAAAPAAPPGSSSGGSLSGGSGRGRHSRDEDDAPGLW